MSFESVFFFYFTSGGHFLQRSGTILAIKHPPPPTHTQTYTHTEGGGGGKGGGEHIVFGADPDGVGVACL